MHGPYLELVQRVRLRVLREMVRNIIAEEALNEGAEAYHAPGHQVGERVPAGGSMCANCKWLKDEQYCSNKYFQRWHAEAKGSKTPSKLPAPADEYCCDNWQG